MRAFSRMHALWAVAKGIDKPRLLELAIIARTTNVELLTLPIYIVEMVNA